MIYLDFYKRILDDDLSRSYSYLSIFNEGVDAGLLEVGDLSKDRHNATLKSAKQSIKVWFQKRFKDQAPDGREAIRGRYYETYAAYRILNALGQKYFESGEWDRIQAYFQKNSDASSGEETNKDAAPDQTESDGMGHISKTKMLFSHVAGIFITLILTVAGMNYLQVEFSLDGREQGIAVFSCEEGSGQSRVILEMLKLRLGKSESFRLVSTDTIQALEVGDYLCDNPDPDALDQVCESLGTEFLLWGTYQRDEGESIWNGCLYQHGRGKRKFRGTGHKIPLMVDAVVNACFRLIEGEDQGTSASTLFSPSSSANFLYAEAERQFQLGNITAAQANFESAYVNYDDLFHLAKIKRAQCESVSGNISAAEIQLDELLDEFGGVLPDETLIELYKELIYINLIQQDKRIENLVVIAKDLTRGKKGLDYLYVVQSEAMYWKEVGDEASANKALASVTEEMLMGSDPETQISAIQFQAIRNYRDGLFQESIDLLYTALDIAQQHNMSHSIANLYCMIANTRIHHIQSDLKATDSELETALDIATRTNNQIDQLRVQFFVGYSAYVQGDKFKSMSILEDISEQSEKIGASSLEIKSKLLITDIALENSDTTKAEWVLQSLEHRIQLLPPQKAMWIYNRLAYFETLKPNLDAALVYLEKHLAIAQSVQDQRMVARNLSNQGEILLAQRQYERAEKCLMEAHELRKSSNPKELITTENLLLRLYRESGNSQRLIEFEASRTTDQE